MLPDNQEGRLRCYRNALRNWNYHGYVRFKNVALEELGKILPDLDAREIARELNRYVEEGGVIHEKQERRPEYVEAEFHYDLRLNIDNRQVYFETVLKVIRDPDDPDDPTIEVVSVHRD
jgi:hypothetical protein